MVNYNVPIWRIKVIQCSILATGLRERLKPNDPIEGEIALLKCLYIVKQFLINLGVVKRHASSVQADTVHFISMGIVSLKTWRTGVTISLALLKDVK